MPVWDSTAAESSPIPEGRGRTCAKWIEWRPSCSRPLVAPDSAHVRSGWSNHRFGFESPSPRTLLPSLASTDRERVQVFVANPAPDVEQCVVTSASAIKAKGRCVEPELAEMRPFRRHVFCQITGFLSPCRQRSEWTKWFTDDSKFRQHSRKCYQPHTGARLCSVFHLPVPLTPLCECSKHFNRKILKMWATIGSNASQTLRGMCCSVGLPE